MTATRMSITVDDEALLKKLEDLENIADVIEEKASGQICETMREAAVQKLTDWGAVDTGNLRNSIETSDCEFVVRTSATSVEMGIQTGVEYAKFVEYGTGPKGDPEAPYAHTSKTVWFQPNPDYMGGLAGGELPYIVRYPQEPRPFMRPALRDNAEVYKDIMAGSIKEVFE